MSIEKRERKKGYVYVVWWKDEARRSHNKTFDLKRDAQAFEAKIKLAKRQGELDDLDAGKEPLSEFVEEWWRLHAEHHLSEKTRIQYRDWLDRHVLPTLGSRHLRKLTPLLLQEWSDDLLTSGVGKETVRKMLGMLQGILERAVTWGRIKVNPARSVKKPPAGRKRTIHPLSPSQVEALRARVSTQRDATIVLVLAYGGLRPGEAFALRWGDVGERTIRVDKAVALGRVKDTKNAKHRTVRMLRPLARDLAEWRMACGRPGDDALVFPDSDGEPWRDHTYKNWLRRVYQPAAKAVGLSNPRLYDLRHSLASLLFAEGRNPAEIAEQMGHTLQTLLSTYTHVIEELRGSPRKSAETLIRQARTKRGHILVTQDSESEAVADEKAP
jgi:integrase